MSCEHCNLELPLRLVFKCDAHCDKILCIVCIKKHAAEVSFTHRTIPDLVRSKA